MKTPKKQPMDSELIRIQGIVRLLDELDDRCWKMKRDCGESAYSRAMVYINSRKGYVFYRFKPPIQ